MDSYQFALPPSRAIEGRITSRRVAATRQSSVELGFSPKLTDNLKLPEVQPFETAGSNTVLAPQSVEQHLMQAVSRRSGMVDAPGIRLGSGPTGRRTRLGSSTFSRAKIRRDRNGAAREGVWGVNSALNRDLGCVT